MKRKSDLYLKDIHECIEKIEEYVKDQNFEEFKSSNKTVDSVLHNLIIIGEAASQIPKEFKEEHPTVPWRNIKDFRNVAIHRYHKVDLQEVWDIIQGELTPLKKNVKKLLEN